MTLPLNVSAIVSLKPLQEHSMITTPNFYCSSLQPDLIKRKPASLMDSTGSRSPFRQRYKEHEHCKNEISNKGLSINVCMLYAILAGHQRTEYVYGWSNEVALAILFIERLKNFLLAGPQKRLGTRAMTNRRFWALAVERLSEFRKSHFAPRGGPRSL